MTKLKAGLGIKGLGMAGLMMASVVSTQLYADDSISITCGNGKIVKIEKSNYKQGADAALCARAGHPAPMKKIGSTKAATGDLSVEGNSGVEVGLLLPAVQAAREAAREKTPSSRQPTTIKPVNGNLGSSPSQAADTSCSGVNACNDMMAACVALGGNVTPSSYDPNTGAPNGATCYTPRN